MEEGVEGMREVPKTEEEPEAPDWAAPTSPADPAEEEAAPPPVTVASSLSSVSDGPSYEEPRRHLAFRSSCWLALHTCAWKCCCYMPA